MSLPRSRRRSRTYRGVKGDSEEIMSVQEQRSELADILRRLKRVEEAVKLSHIRSHARNAGAIGEGATIADLTRRIHEVKRLTSSNITRRTKQRKRRMNSSK